MREVKFRAERKDNLGWAYGHYVKTPITTEFHCDGNFLDSGGVGRHCIIQDYVAHEIDIETLGEFTGLKDKNKVDIYEGDILGLDDPEDTSRCKVAFDKGAFKKIYKDDNKEIYKIHFDSIDEEMWKVIGNIYENPELLK